jgi:hypothetical protein
MNTSLVAIHYNNNVTRVYVLNAIKHVPLKNLFQKPGTDLSKVQDKKQWPTRV